MKSIYGEYEVIWLCSAWNIFLHIFRFLMLCILIFLSVW
jgi:hypothetical protein